MLNLIYEISDIYRNKDIYIWDVSRNSMMTFSQLAFTEIKVSGFVSDIAKYIGEKIINLSVISLDELKKNKNAILVIPDYSPRYVEYIENALIQKECGNIIVKHKDMYEISKYLKSHSIYVYGTGKAAEKMLELSKENALEIIGFVNTRAKSEERFKGYDVFSLGALNEIKDIPFVVAANSIVAKEEIIKELHKNGCANIFVDCILDTPSCLMEPSFLRLSEAIKEKKKIFIFSEEGEYLNTLKKVLGRYDIAIEGIVSESQSGTDGMINVYDLLYYNLNNIYIYINERIPEKMQVACKLLKCIGLSYMDYTGAIPSRSNYADYRVVSDILLGATVYGNKEKRGFYIYGDEKTEDKKILVLGGSTSTENAYTEDTWVKIIYDKYLKDKNITIYNGANCGFDIVQELLVLLRDGPSIRPDIVISMSGVNNLYARSDLLVGNYNFLDEWGYENFDNDFNILTMLQWFRNFAPQSLYNSGLKNEENRFEFWYRNEKILGQVSKILNAKSFMFLQPMMIDTKKMNLYQYSLSILEENKNANEDFLSGDERQGIIDLKDLIPYEKSMYIDGCHYSSKGAEVLADCVYSHISDYL